MITETIISCIAIITYVATLLTALVRAINEGNES